MHHSILLIPAITGPIFIITGFILLKFPPRKINGMYGYRTSSSMKNQERWDFAQVYSAKEMIKLGGILMLSSLLGLLFEPNEKISILVELGLLIILVVLLITRVERAIQKHFEK